MLPSPEPMPGRRERTSYAASFTFTAAPRGNTLPGAALCRTTLARLGPRTAHPAELATSFPEGDPVRFQRLALELGNHTSGVGELARPDRRAHPALGGDTHIDLPAHSGRQARLR